MLLKSYVAHFTVRGEMGFLQNTQIFVTSLESIEEMREKWAKKIHDMCAPFQREKFFFAAFSRENVLKVVTFASF